MKTHDKTATHAFVDYKAIKQATSIVSILDHYHLTETLHRRGDSFTGPCPLHGGHNPTQFRVSISKNCWNCFGDCKRGGNIIDFVSIKEGVPFRDAALLIQEWFSLASPARASATTAEAPPTPAPTEEDVRTENPPLGFSLAHLDPAHPYLSTRGLTPETIATFGLGYCAKGSMAGRIAIPIHNAKGELVAYVGRFPGEPPAGEGKYRLPKGFKKSLELFNYRRAAQAPAAAPLIVVEGFFDVLTLAQHGYAKIVAVMGSSLSPAQAALIAQLVGPRGRVLFLFDEDDAGRAGRAEAVARLASHCFTKILALPIEGQQPEHLSAAELATLLPENIHPSQSEAICDECGNHVPHIIGCPDGAEICQACLDAGAH